MAVLDGLEPREVFRFFEEIAGIPHGSRNTGAISAYLVAFAEERGLEVYRDEADNVVIKKPGTAGYEDHEPVILQGHIDMVCVKDAGVEIDLDTEPIRLLCDGETITADGTSLGADDGIAVAAVMAILDSDAIAHPPIEAVFTADEEIGMLGAQALDMGVLQGRRMINIDSEDEGIITCGCAGGATVKGRIPVVRAAECAGEVCRIVIEGLAGGHSGIEIVKGGANAHVLMGRLLERLCERLAGAWELICVDGGEKDNAIPAAAVAVVRGDVEAMTRVADECERVFLQEYHATDAGLRVRVESGAGDGAGDGADIVAAAPMDEVSRARVIDALRVLPAGVQRMSPDVEGLVQTSLNMGILHTTEEAVEIGFSVRSGVATEKEELIARVCRMIRLIGGEPAVEGAYPGWEYRVESPLREHMVATFERVYGRTPVVDVIHAGLECGFFAARIDGLDAVSVGPDMKGVHTTGETLDVGSVARTWKYMVEVLRGM
ncbi:MAG: aminoacyl-histidine dipeptidase [Eubacterium sp.]|nr:aminoacyl-histidine dipeptidase [Eubacterium sp.]